MKRWGIGLLAAIATFLSLWGWPGSTAAQHPPTVAQAPETAESPTLESAGLTLEEMADGVYALIASTDFPPVDFESVAICNGAFIVGSDSVLVIDPFQTDALATLLFDTVASITDLPIRYVVNTHYHFDHTGGNSAAESRNIAVVGRGPIREWMTTRNLDFDPDPTPPTLVMSDGDIWLGDRQVFIQDMEGHSGGTDIILYIPDVDVLIAGDLFFNERIPYLLDGNIPLWQETLDTLISLYPTATVLPGHGPVTDTSGLERQKDYVDYLESAARLWKVSGVTQEEAIASTSLPAEYADYKFQALFPGNLEVAYQQITLQQSPEEMELSYKADSPYLRGL
jgi:glyoxylase-like metal-dependent hydrolase (beta-lactamase superfamily II)